MCGYTHWGQDPVHVQRRIDHFNRLWNDTTLPTPKRHSAKAQRKRWEKRLEEVLLKKLLKEVETGG